MENDRLNHRIISDEEFAAGLRAEGIPERAIEHMLLVSNQAARQNWFKKEENPDEDEEPDEHS